MEGPAPAPDVEAVAPAREERRAIEIQIEARALHLEVLCVHPVVAGADVANRAWAPTTARARPALCQGTCAPNVPPA